MTTLVGSGSVLNTSRRAEPAGSERFTLSLDPQAVVTSFAIHATMRP